VFDSKEISKRAKLRAIEIQAETKRKRRHIEAAAVLCVMCAVMSVFLFNNLPTKNPDIEGYIVSIIDEQTPLSVSPFISKDENAVPFDIFLAERTKLFPVPCYSAVTVHSASNRADMVLPNPPDSTFWYSFEIFLADTGAVLYESGLVEPGMCIADPELNETLPAGSYEAVLKIRFHVFENHVTCGDADVNFILTFN